MKNIEEKINAVKQFLEENLSEKRREHCLRVAEYSKYLAQIYDKSGDLVNLAYFTGLAHDMCKEFSDERQVEISSRDGLEISEIEKQRLNLLHGRTAAVVLKEEFGVDDEQVLNAIRFHTFGTPDFKDLAKIVFVADKIEPGRPEYAKKFRDLVGKVSLDELVLEVASFGMQHVKNKGLNICPLTIQMCEVLKKGSL